MNKFTAPLLALFAAAMLIDPALAQLIDSTTDYPTDIKSATNGNESFRSVALTFINFFLFFLGLVATAFIIFGGFLYVTSRGDDQAVEKAKKILTYAAVGIFVILISFALVNTLLQSAGGLRANT